MDQLGSLAQHQPRQTGQDARFEVHGEIAERVGVDVIFQEREDARGQLIILQGGFHLVVHGQILR